MLQSKMLPETIEQAMRETAQSLYASLKKSGELKAYVQQLVDEIQDQIGQAAAPTSDLDHLPFMEKVAMMNARGAAAMEIALAQALEFPRDDPPDSQQDES